MQSRFALLIPLLLLCLPACEKEELSSHSGPVYEQGQALPPLPPCSSALLDLVSASGSSIGAAPYAYDYGQAEVMYDNSDLILLYSLGPGWRASDMWVYEGPLAGVPLNLSGNFDLSLFDHYAYNPSRNSYMEYRQVATGSPLCNHYVVALRVFRLNLFQQPIGIQTVYFSGNALANGFEFEFCKTPCDPAGMINTCGTNSPL